MNEQSRTALIEHLQTDAYNGMSVEQAHERFHAPQTIAAVYEPDHTLYTWRKIYAVVGGAKGYAVKQAITAMIPQMPYLEDVVEMLSTYAAGGGISFGTDDFRGMIDMLVLGQVITGDEGDTLKAIGRRVLAPATIADAPIVAVLYSIRDSGRPNAIPVDEFTEIFNEARPQ